MQHSHFVNTFRVHFKGEGRERERGRARGRVCEYVGHCWKIDGAGNMLKRKDTKQSTFY